MQQSLLVAAVICIVIFVGVSVPVLLQLRRTLRSAEVFLETTGVTLEQTLEQISSAAATVNRAAVRIDQNTEGLERLFKGFGNVAGLVGRLRELLHGNSRPATEPDAAAPVVHSPGGRQGHERVDQSKARKGGVVA